MPSIIYDFLMPNRLMSVINSSHTPITLTPRSNDQISFCSLLNTGIGRVVINMGAVGTVTQARLPTEPIPNPADVMQVILPPSMVAPMIVSCPKPPFDVTAISDTSVASQVFLCLAGAQS